MVGAIAGSSDFTYLIVARDAMLYISSNGGSKWKNPKSSFFASDAQFTAVAMDFDGSVLVAATTDGLYLSRG